MHRRIGNVLAFPPLDVGVTRAENSGHVASIPCLVGTLDDIHVLLRHRLRALLCEAFGGSTSLVDVAVEEPARDSARGPDKHEPVSLANPDVRWTSDWAAICAHGCVDHPVAEIQHLIEYLVIGLVADQPVRERGANRSMSLERANADDLKHRVRGVEGQGLVGVGARDGG